MMDLSALAVMTPDDIRARGEDAALAAFKRMRWPETNGAPVCPRCGTGHPYDIATRGTFKCRSCYHQFSPVSGTIFASRKMPFGQMLIVTCCLLRGQSAIKAAAEANCQWRTAYDLAIKLRLQMQEHKQ